MLNAFPGYEFVDGKNMYRGEDLGKGGYVYAEPGMYTNVALLDVQSMHPTSIINMNCFGEYTKRYKDIYNARILIKHHDYEEAKKLLNGLLAPFLTDEQQADELAKALKLCLNSTYGLTSANFDNPFRDIRNKNNIVALRGALFMRTLQDEVKDRGFTVAHIKTDSIKVPEATPEIIHFIMEFGKKYGYVFEHEATYDRMCLVNDAVYIARYKDGKHAGEWTATGAQFQVPYVFKKLFSKEPIEFKDMCETKSVSTALYLDMNEGLIVNQEADKELADRVKSGENPEVDGDYIQFVNPAFKNVSNRELKKFVDDSHNYRFVGKVGLFCPIKKGCGGGLLMREKDGKFSAATGSKGYRWLESEVVKTLGKEADIDRSYYDKLVDDAVESIEKYGDFEWFASTD